MLHIQPKAKILVLAICLTGLLSGCGLLEIFGEALGGVCRRPLVVTTDEDKNDGACTADDCSLREAVITANACDGHQEIILQTSTRYRLTIEGRDEDAAATGDLDITGDVDFLYAPPEDEFYSTSSVIDATGIDRVLDIHSGTVMFLGTISLRGGIAYDGGALRIAAGATGSFDTLEISDSSGGGGDGGAVYNDGQLIASSYFHLMHNRSQLGGAIYTSGTVSLRGEGCWIEDNIAQQGAIYIAPGGEVHLESCSIVNNRGGALFNQGEFTFRGGDMAFNQAIDSTDLVRMHTIVFNDEGASAEFENVTITGNYARGGRGKLVLNRGMLVINHVTLYQNPLFEIGLASEGAGSIQLHNSILGQSGESLCEGTVESTGGNIFDVSSCGANPELGDIVVDSSDSFGLQPLLSYFFAISFYPLGESSPAVDAGTDPCPEQDVRWASRPIDGDGDGVARCDSGAYEYEPWSPTFPPIRAPLPDDVLATPATPEMREAIARPTGPTTCRGGPSGVYPPLGYFDLGDSLVLQSRNADASWLEVQGEGVPTCWVHEDLLEVDPDFDLMDLPPGVIPPTPTWTPVPPTNTPGPQGCWHQGPNDNQPLCYLPCPPNPNPGGACTP